MKQRMIIIAIVMLSIALTGLMIIQGYWIYSAYRIKQANFVRTVNESSHSVILTMEKMEIMQRMQQQEIAGIGEITATEAMDSINQVLLREMQKINSRKDLEVFFNKFFMARELMEDRMFRFDERSRKKTDLILLDSLLKDQFDQRNLDTEWQFGVFNPFRQEMIMKEASFQADALRDPERSFHFELFPDDQNVHPDFLLLYFPYERQYVLGQVWPLVIISIVLAIIIILSFIYTLIMYFRQNKLSELKTDFINNMTHEFKTPIATISLAADSINSPMISGDADKVRRFANIIKQENKRMNNQVEKVLQMALIDRREFSLNLSEVNLHEVIEQALINFGIRVKQRQGRLEGKHEATRPIIQGDLTHLSNIVNNLLDNAEKYSPDSPEITILTRDVKGGVEMTVQDKGMGMSKEARKHIFDKFYRVHTGNVHDVKGFGLGLSYVKAIVTAHKGTIEVKSEPGKGSSFILFFPYQADTARTGKYLHP